MIIEPMYYVSTKEYPQGGPLCAHLGLRIQEGAFLIRKTDEEGRVFAIVQGRKLADICCEAFNNQLSL